MGLFRFSIIGCCSHSVVGHLVCAVASHSNLVLPPSVRSVGTTAAETDTVSLQLNYTVKSYLDPWSIFALLYKFFMIIKSCTTSSFYYGLCHT